jgi:hypothetical protein
VRRQFTRGCRTSQLNIIVHYTRRDIYALAYRVCVYVYVSFFYNTRRSLLEIAMSTELESVRSATMKGDERRTTNLLLEY